jgi:hypothetical protein
MPAEQLMMIYGGFPALNQNRLAVSVPEFVDYRQAQSFAAAGAFDNGGCSIIEWQDGLPTVLCVNQTADRFS